jgi:hypothetical protein
MLPQIFRFVISRLVPFNPCPHELGKSHPTWRCRSDDSQSLICKRLWGWRKDRKPLQNTSPQPAGSSGKRGVTSRSFTSTSAQLYSVNCIGAESDETQVERASTASCK